jgi:tetratricopeptide (TPR) repeat protein
VVYKAVQVSLNRPVALKMIRLGTEADEQDLARFQTEAEAAAQLVHPNIVQIYEVGKDALRPYFSQEYVAGGSLDKFLGATPQPPPLGARLVERLAWAIDFAHGHDILHRDLKPANILLGAVEGGQTPRPSRTVSGEDDLPWVPKIADFGLAKRLADEGGQTQTGAVLGTPAYMAPEQAEGRKNIGPGVDIYALGAILYETLTGRPPFRAATAWDTIYQVLNDDPVPPTRLQPRIPRDLETICLKCLEKDSTRRYLRAGDLADDLGRFLRDEPICARPVGVAERLWRWARRNPRVAALVSAFFLTLSLGLMLVTLLWARAETHRLAAESAREQTKTEKEAADESSRQARAAVKELFVIAAENPLFQTDGMQPARKLLLQTALRYFRDFTSQPRDDPALWSELADVHERLATILDLIGTKSEVLAELEKARDFYLQLLRDHPDDLDYQGRLALVLGRIGQLYGETGQAARGENSLDQALKIAQRLAQAEPEVVNRQLDLASTWRKKGNLLHQRGKPAEALAAFQHGRELLEPLTRTPASFRACSELSACLVGMGHAFEKKGQIPEAREVYRQALDLQTRIFHERPKDPRERSEVARIYGALGLVQASLGDRKGSLDSYQKAIELREISVRANPTVVPYREELATAYFNLGEEQRAHSDPEKALEFHNKALAQFLELARTNPDTVDYHHRLSTTHLALHYVHRANKQLVQASEHLKEALAEAELTLARSPEVPVYRLQLVLCHTTSAEMDRDAQKYAQSLQTFQNAAGILQKYVQSDFSYPPYKGKLAYVYVNIAYLQEKAGAYEEAIRTQLQGYLLRKELAKRYPMIPEYQKALQRSQANLEGGTRVYLGSFLSPTRPLEPGQIRASAQKAKRLLEQWARDFPEIPIFKKELERVRSY